MEDLSFKENKPCNCTTASGVQSILDSVTLPPSRENNRGNSLAACAYLSSTPNRDHLGFSRKGRGSEDAKWLYFSLSDQVVILGLRP